VKEILQQLAAYNKWANLRLLDCIKDVPPHLLELEMKSSFTTISKTLMHMWDAENIWWQRVKLSEHIIPPSARFEGSALDIISALLQQNELWKQWIDQARPMALEHEFIYKTLKGETFKQPVAEVLLHIFNHGSYHRGQLVNLLRQAGIEKIPATDFIVFTRGKKS
jgi:uncharacterized damage-inducible protein DinB